VTLRRAMLNRKRQQGGWGLTSRPTPSKFKNLF
jgi:hypothetical protein